MYGTDESETWRLLWEERRPTREEDRGEDQRGLSEEHMVESVVEGVLRKRWEVSGQVPGEESQETWVVNTEGVVWLSKHFRL